MKASDYDYNKYDSISLALKADALDRMLEFYKVFGWELYEKEEDRRYFDIVHVRLIREHKIENKDKLQLLQIKMEKAVNSFAVKRRDRHAGSTVLGLTSGVFSLLLIIFGIFSVLKLSAPLSLFLGIPMMAVGIILPVSLIVPLRRMLKRENKSFMAAYREMGAEISKILSKVEKIRRGENE